MIIEIVTRILIQFFSPRPSISRKGGKLILESTWRTSLFTLLARKRRVEVDPVARTFRIHDRRFWFWISNRRIAFNQIQDIVFAYQDVGSTNFTASDAQEVFILGLTLHPKLEKVDLFKFYGVGEFTNNSIFPDWMMWDEFIPGMVVANRRGDDATTLADILSQMTGKPLSGIWY